jgi:hypothetical protein
MAAAAVPLERVGFLPSNLLLIVPLCARAKRSVAALV